MCVSTNGSPVWQVNYEITMRRGNLPSIVRYKSSSQAYRTVHLSRFFTHFQRTLTELILQLKYSVASLPQIFFFFLSSQSYMQRIE